MRATPITVITDHLNLKIAIENSVIFILWMPW